MKKISDRGVLVFLMKSLIALPQSASFSYHSAPVEVKYGQALHECQSEGKNSPSMCCFRDKLKDSDQLPVQHEISRELFSLPCSQPEEQKR